MGVVKYNLLPFHIVACTFRQLHASVGLKVMRKKHCVDKIDIDIVFVLDLVGCDKTAR